jgi:putative glycosyltransferase (TIGR04348 family)
MKIALVTPAAAGTRSGNEHTAQRWARFLRALGHRVTVAVRWGGEPVDAMIALHARKSFPSIEQFHARLPGAPLGVVLTGTDLYRDIRTSREAQRSLVLASRLVVLQPEGRRELPARLRAKTRVIFQSSDTSVRHAPPKSCFRVAVVGHLREEKDPFRAVRALALLPRLEELELLHLGAALSPGMKSAAARWMKREPRYRWLGSIPHGETLRRLSTCHLLVVSSLMEGGANVICEAARIGVPVLASRISGNIGMLGRGYPGYFALSEEHKLSALIARAAGDDAYYRRLKEKMRARRKLFAPSAERSALRRLVGELKKRS